MTNGEVVFEQSISPDEAAREIDRLEEEIQHRYRRLAELRRLRPEAVKDYELIGWDGQRVKLSEMFGEKNDLIVIHNMGARCSYCTLWADGFNGVVDHLESRAAFVVVSPDPPEKQRDFARGRGWRFQMYSGSSSTFIEDMGYRREIEGVSYWWPGYSTFHRNDDGSIVRIAHADFGPGDPYCSVWHMFDLLADGPGDWQPSMLVRPTDG